MEKAAAIKLLLKYKWIGLLLLAASAYGAHHIYKEYTMPPPLVYLIPEDYFGPVFVFFGSPMEWNSSRTRWGMRRKCRRMV